MSRHKVQFHLSEKAISEPYQEPYRWVMLALLWLLYFSFGLVEAFGATKTTLGKSFKTDSFRKREFLFTYLTYFLQGAASGRERHQGVLHTDQVRHFYHYQYEEVCHIP